MKEAVRPFTLYVQVSATPGAGTIIVIGLAGQKLGTPQLLLSLLNILMFEGSPRSESKVSRPQPAGRPGLDQEVAPAPPLAVKRKPEVG